MRNFHFQVSLVTHGKARYSQLIVEHNRLLFEHNLRHNVIVLRVTLKSIMLKFSGIMYLTLEKLETMVMEKYVG